MFAFSTVELAQEAGVNPRTIYNSVARHGHYLNITPVKLHNGKVLWPADLVYKATQGYSRSHYMKPDNSTAAAAALLDAVWTTEGYAGDIRGDLSEDATYTANIALQNLGYVVWGLRQRITNDRPGAYLQTFLMAEIKSAFDFATRDLSKTGDDYIEAVAKVANFAEELQRALIEGRMPNV